MTLEDVEKGKPGREPVARMLCEVKEHTHVNFKLLHRIVEYQLFDIDRGPMNTMSELEVYGENTRGLMLYLNLHLLSIDNKEAIWLPHTSADVSASAMSLKRFPTIWLCREATSPTMY